MKKNKFGFTLIELLAVIVIIAIIAFITIPLILGVIENAKKGSAVSSAYGYIDAVEKSIIINELSKGNSLSDGTYNVVETDLSSIKLKGNRPTKGTLIISNKKVASGTLTIDGYIIAYDGEKAIVLESIPEITPISPEVTINEGDDILVTSYFTISGETSTVCKEGENILTSTSGLSYGTHTVTCTVKNDKNKTASASVNILVKYVEAILNKAAPEFSDSMIPVVYDSASSTWKKANLFTPWYSYSNYNWANMVTVKTTGTQTREYYLNAAPGTIIPMSDINTMWVWIPKYEYKFISTSLSEISVNFIDKSVTTASAGYIIHPAFNFGGTKLNGIWVAKFEASGNPDNLTIIPNVNSISNNVLNNMFWMSRNMLYYASNYGFNISKINTHMMKSIEWGSVAYLSNSRYGKYNNPSYSGVNKEIYINNYISSGSLLTITGCSSGGPTTATNSTSCPYRYDTNLSGTGASTTGTIYGIYDMNGGKYEYVMANMKNSSGGFSASASGLAAAPEEKYYDTYNYSYNTSTDHSTRGLIGDSTKEAIVSLNTWYLGYAQLPTSLSPWIMRGGSGNDGQSASIFAFNNTDGGSSARVGFRPTLIVY